MSGKSQRLWARKMLFTLHYYIAFELEICDTSFSDWLWIKTFREIHVSKHKTHFYRHFSTNSLIFAKQKSKIKKIHGFTD